MVATVGPMVAASLRAGRQTETLPAPLGAHHPGGRKVVEMEGAEHAGSILPRQMDSSTSFTG